MKTEDQIRDRLTDYLIERRKCVQTNEIDDFIKWTEYANILNWVLGEPELNIVDK
jgi:hypothetical protein